MRLSFFVLLFVSASASIVTITTVYPRLMPTQVDTPPLQLIVSPATAAAQPLNWTLIFSFGLPPIFLNSTTSDNGVISLQLPMINVSGPLLLKQVDAPDSVGVYVTYYDAPTFTGWSVDGSANLTTAGLVQVRLTLEPNSAPIPVANPKVLVLCDCPHIQLGMIHVKPTLLLPGGSTYSPPVKIVAFEYLTEGRVDSTGTQLTFMAQGMPSEGCSRVSASITYIGEHIFHCAGSSLVFHITPVPPMKVVSLYPSPISESAWVTSHNRARVILASRYQMAVDASVHYETTLTGLGAAGILTASSDDSQMLRAIYNDSARLIICAGNEYEEYALQAAPLHPEVFFLITDAFVERLSPLPNLVHASGRMYEANYLCGFLAAATTKTGEIGYLMSVNLTGSYWDLNAFAIGAQAAVQQGMAPQNLRIHAWLIGWYVDEWADTYAVADLIDNHNVDVILPMTEGVVAHTDCHKRGCFTIAVNGGELGDLGDGVLMSVDFRWEPTYIEFVSRIISGRPFHDSDYKAGVSTSYDLSEISHHVPLEGQAEVLRLSIALTQGIDNAEKVFCLDETLQPLVDLSGTVRLGAANPPPHAQYGGLGSTRSLCMSTEDIRSMDWILNSVTYYGLFEPPPRPDPPQHVHLHISPIAFAIAGCLGGLVLLVVVACSVGIFLFSDADAIRYSSPLFLQIINVGAGAMGATLLWGVVGTLDDSVCTGRKALDNLAFILLFGSLFCKTYRIHMLFNNKHLKRLRMTAKKVLHMVLLILTAEAIALIALNLVQPRVLLHQTIQLADGGSFGVDKCGPQAGSTVDGYQVLDIIHFLLLVWGGYLAYRTRNVPLGFNESRYIGVALYNFIMCAIISLILQSAASTSPSLDLYADTMVLGVAPLFSLLVFYAPKFYSVYQGMTDTYKMPDGWYSLGKRRTDMGNSDKNLAGENRGGNFGGIAIPIGNGPAQGHQRGSPIAGSIILGQGSNRFQLVPTGAGSCELLTDAEAGRSRAPSLAHAAVGATESSVELSTLKPVSAAARHTVVPNSPGARPLSVHQETSERLNTSTTAETEEIDETAAPSSGIFSWLRKVRQHAPQAASRPGNVKVHPLPSSASTSAPGSADPVAAVESTPLSPNPTNCRTTT
jgi:basic membrane lipoprotein Med (substrate-binding protein (PBP1-ABC) superfamily)